MSADAPGFARATTDRAGDRPASPPGETASPTGATVVDDAEPAGDTTGGDHWVAPRLRGHRSPTNRYVAGVLGGQGERFGIDPLFLRIAVVAAAVGFRHGAPALVPILYALAWIVIPLPGERALLTSSRHRRAQQEIAGAAALAVVVSMVFGVRSIWVAAAFAMAAWMLLAGATPHPTDSDRTPPDATTPGSRVSAAGSAVGAAAVRGDTATGAAWGRARRGVQSPLEALRARPARLRPARRQPALWPLTLALLIGLGVVFATVDASRSPGADPAVFVNLALVIIGGVVALSAWRGRAGGTALLALPLIPLWIAFSVAGIGRYPGVGSETRTLDAYPASGAASYELGYGSLDVSVSPEAVPEGETLTLDVAVTAGKAVVRVPADARVVLSSRVGVGRVRVRGHQWYEVIDDAGVVDTTRRRTYEPTDDCALVDSGSYVDFIGQYPPDLQQLISDADGNLTPVQLGSLRSQGFPTPEISPAVAGLPATWTFAWDGYGSPCTPQPPPSNPGTVIIDGTIGIGGLTVVQSN